MSSSWDVFHSVRLEVERGLAAEVVRDRLAAGTLTGTDLIRPAGTARWTQISKVAAFQAPAAPAAPAPPAVPTLPEVAPPSPRVAPPRPVPVPAPPATVVPPTRAEIPPPPRAEAPPVPPAPVEELQLRPIAPSAPVAPSEPPPRPAPTPAAESGPPAEFELEYADEDEDDSIEAIAADGSIEAGVVDLDDSVEAEVVDLDDSVEAEPVPAASFAPPDDDDEDEFAAEAGADPYAEEEAEDFDPAILPDDEAGGPRPPELADPLAPELEAERDAEDDPAAEFSLTRPSTEKVEELDLAAMVDVAFQLVLFFLVTASTIVFKTLEIPRPNEDKPPEAAAQSRAKSIDELEKDYILVEVDAEGAVKVDHLPVNADRAALVEKLRQARETTGRKAMLLSADFNTRHRNAVLAFDVASEIDLQVAIAQPTGKN